MSAIEAEANNFSWQRTHGFCLIPAGALGMLRYKQLRHPLDFPFQIASYGG